MSTARVAMMRAAQAAGVERIVHCSSVAALGFARGWRRRPTRPRRSIRRRFVGTYKRSKYESEQAVLRLVRRGWLPAVIVNPAAPVGPRDIKPTPTGRLIRDAARGRIPAYVDTGLNVVHVDDVAEGHALALERGRIGERYILGGENLPLGRLLALVAEVAGRKPPRIALPIGPLFPVAAVMEVLARITGMEPIATRDQLKMARKKMYYSSAKAVAELGYQRAPGAPGGGGRGRLVPRQRDGAMSGPRRGQTGLPPLAGRGRETDPGTAPQGSSSSACCIARSTPRRMTTLALLAVLIWLYLLLLHGRFWQAGPVLAPQRPAAAPPVAVVVPARDEAPTIGPVLRSLLAQDYPGPFRVILVDDGSTDGTGDIARRIDDPRLTVLTGARRPAGWSGKLWAVAQGIDAADDADLLLLTDADIVHDPAHLATLVAKAEAAGPGPGLGDGGAELRQPGRTRPGAGLRVLLPDAVPVRAGERSAARHRRGGGRHHPDPPARAAPHRRHRRGARRADRRRRRSAAAVKRGGRIWLGHSALARSVRPYPGFADIWRMIARTAYVQLHYSPLLLLAPCSAMALVYLLPPLAALFGHGVARWLGLAAWAMMARRLPADAAPLRAVPALERGSAADRGLLPGGDHRLRGEPLSGPRRGVEGSSLSGDGRVMDATVETIANVEAWSGKDRGDENFPVGSWLIRADLRQHVHAFYAFARNADDIADSGRPRPEDKVARLDIMEDVLLGRRDTGSPSALRLRESLAETEVTPQHATELLIAFRQDATKQRYATLTELYEYCRYSAAPVGRHVLDLHGESHTGRMRRPTRCAVRCSC